MSPLPVWMTPEWRRTVLAIVFAASGAVLTAFAFWLAWAVLHAPWPPSLAAARLHIIGAGFYAVLGLLGLVLTGLSMTVALRSVSAKFAGAEAKIDGGNHDDGPEVPEE